MIDYPVYIFKNCSTESKGGGLNNVIVAHLEVPEELTHPLAHNILYLHTHKYHILIP